MTNPKRIHEVAQPIFVAEVYIMCGDEVLMFKRSETKKKFPGFWSIPGGHIDESEDPLAAAIREVKEETGLTVSPDDIKLRVVAMHHHLDRKEMYVAFAFAVTVTERVMSKEQTEEGSAHWVKKSEMMGKENVFEPVRYYFDHVLKERPGIIYNMSEWENSQLVRVLSETVDRNS
jgi:8-oxo-dGTP diphosphatase